MRLVLAGGGHGHLDIIHAIPELRRLGYDVTVIDPSRRLCYSGMLASAIGASVERTACTIPIFRLTEAQGGTFIDGSVVRIDTEQKILFLSDGSTVPWDILSCAVGSRTVISLPSTDADRSKIQPLKPFLFSTMDTLEQVKKPSRIAVIGGGASGVELAGNIRRRFGNDPPEKRIDVDLFTAGKRLIADLPEAVGDYAYTSLTSSGVVVRLGMKVSSVEEGSVYAGTPVKQFGAYELVLLATGFDVPPLFRESGLPVEEDGSLIVGTTLKVEGEPVFAVGDCASVNPYNLAKVGVHAVREGSVLLDNIRRYSRGEELRRYRNRRRYLQIINLGDGTAIAVWGKRVGKGRLWMVLKERIDWSFVRTSGRSIFPSLRPPPRPGKRNSS